MLLKVKQLLKKPVVAYHKSLNFRNFKKYLVSQKTSEHLIIFDLDNTLANTFPEIGKSDANEMYKNIPPLNNMLTRANNEFKSKNSCIILTARDYKYKSSTEFWLKTNIAFDNVPLFMVPNAIDKIAYLEKAIENFEKVTYYDDLSYNHEKGEVKFHADVIEKVTQMPIDYFGYEDINNINNK